MLNLAYNEAEEMKSGWNGKLGSGDKAAKNEGEAKKRMVAGVYKMGSVRKPGEEMDSIVYQCMHRRVEKERR